MKKFKYLFSVLLVVIMCFTTASFAATNSGLDWDVTIDVNDRANLFSTEAIADANTRIKQLEDKYGYDIVVITTNNSLYSDSYDYGNDILDTNPYGLGETNNAVMLLINMTSRSVGIVANEADSHNYFDRRATDELLDNIAPALTNTNYDEALNSFLDGCDKTLDTSILPILFNPRSLIFGVIACLGWMTYMWRLHRPVRKATDANNYVDKNSLNLTRKADIFLHTKTTRTVKPKNSSGGGSHRSGGSRGF